MCDNHFTFLFLQNIFTKRHLTLLRIQEKQNITIA